MPNNIRYVQKSLTVNNGAEGTVDILTSVSGVKQSTVAITSDQAASLDLLAYSGQTKVLDMPTEHLNASTHWQDLPLDVDVDGKITVGFRNNTGGAVTKVITLRYNYGS